MVYYYRMMSEKYHKEPYSCSLFGGRWNPKGYPMIYAASSASLAALEYLSIKGTAVAQQPWYVMVYEIKEMHWIGELEVAGLPANWDSLPHGKATQEFGKFWLKEQTFPFLKVPSARLHTSFYPEEHNLLINPLFSEINELFRFAEARKFAFKIGG
jgi:RES domain-containing protein